MKEVPLQLLNLNLSVTQMQNFTKCHHLWKDTFFLTLRQFLYVTCVAGQLLSHHKQQVGVVYSLGMDQPVEHKHFRNLTTYDMRNASFILAHLKHYSG